ncbi:unnamed protein product [Larinioides sclopetarius]|uniref:Uncharacterized protein n=1 Tax=Larinioides sclopetarius TaxID=280406 RepID=A0AAV1ZGW8_9ARAC
MKINNAVLLLLKSKLSLIYGKFYKSKLSLIYYSLEEEILSRN